MLSLFTLFSLVASACAYSVLTPDNSTGWAVGGLNTVTWMRVNTDQAEFTMVLVNQDKNYLPSGSEILIATVDGSLGKIDVPAPSGGFPVGTGFQVNFVNDTNHLDTILAQSSQFTIAPANSTTSSTVTSSNAVVTPAATTGTNPSQTDSASDGSLNPTDSATNTTTPAKNGADRITAAGSTGLIFAALAAFFL